VSAQSAVCVQEAEREHKEELEKAVQAHQELQEKLESMEKQEQALHAQVGCFLSQGERQESTLA